MFEGSIADELSRLLQAGAEQRVILPERAYEDIVKTKEVPELLRGCRADIVVAHGNRKDNAKRSNISDKVDLVLEIKRTGVAMAGVEKDLTRLAYWLTNKSNQDARAFLVVVTQGSKPPKSPGNGQQMVSDGKGIANKQMLSFFVNGLGTVRYRVRRVLKASSSFKAESKAHFVTLLEVMTCV